MFHLSGNNRRDSHTFRNKDAQILFYGCTPDNVVISFRGDSSLQLNCAIVLREYARHTRKMRAYLASHQYARIGLI